MSYPPSLTLGCILRALPDFYRSPHGLVEIQRAYHFGYANPLWPKAGAVHAHFRASMGSGDTRGHGNKAERRILKIISSKPKY